VRNLEVDAETTPLRLPEYYQFELCGPDIAEVWHRGSVIASWLLDLTASELTERAEPEELCGLPPLSVPGRGRLVQCNIWSLQKLANGE
jgi:6-phosphogluconate dehydrogenase